MFTGLVEEVGTVASVKRSGGGILLTVAAQKSVRGMHVNDSISINGVCQTVVAKRGRTFAVVAVEETLKKTTLGALRKGEKVNLELPMRLNGRLGGHMVLGHVDDVGTVVGIERRETSWMYAIELPSGCARYVVPIGSIAIDGVSLTVAELERNIIRVSIIPHTLLHTTFRWYSVSRRVNVEVDVISKFVERLLRPDGSGTEGGIPITERMLRDAGY
jgi:riboflavin synthase